VFEHDQTLRHLAFFEEVAAHEEHEGDWRGATAGLVTLRLIDQWIEEGPDVTTPDGWSVRAVLCAIDQMDGGSPIPSILRSIVGAMQVSPGATVHDVVPRLMAYARGLEYEAKWRLAADVYEMVIAYTHPVQESDTAIMAHLQYAAALRTLGHFERAQVAYTTAGMIADQAGDMIGVLRARIGDAKLAVARGNLPEAAAVLDATIAKASELGITAIRSMALHDRAMVAGLSGRHELAIELAYEALRESTSLIDRDRILNDIGTAFQMLGLRSVARDAFLVLSATAQEQYMRWVASLSLMSIAAEEGSEPVFEQWRRSVRARELPPALQIEYYIRLGRAYRELDREDMGQIALAKAVELADHHGYFGLLFEAEQALAAPVKKRAAAPTQPYDATVEGVAAAMRDMRISATT
jgi:tetratricopeptide (TPR) repeat protein